MNREHNKQVKGLFFETIEAALAEDFDFKNAKQAKDVLKLLKSLVKDLTVEDIYHGVSNFETEDEE